MRYLSVKNWDKFQHYKKRNPPWIKLHCELLANYDFNCLQDASKSHLILIWLMASQCDNKIPNDPTWLQKKLGTEKEPDINLLIEKGFLEYVADCKQDASNMLATCISKAEAEAEAEAYKTPMSLQQSVSEKSKKIPYEEIKNLYHKILPDHPKIKILTPARKSSIRQRHIQDMDCSLDEWESYFGLVSRSEFLTGKTQPINGRKVFIADLEWICKQGNFAKIYEGKYHGKI